MVVLVAAIGVFVLLATLIGLELWAPAREFEAVPGWRLKCVAFTPMIAAISAAVPLVLAPWIEAIRLLPGYRLGLVGGAVVGIVSSELVIYWLHRLHHRVDFLWRWIHQLHHSAERVDAFGAAYFHPFEIVEGTAVGVIFFSVVLGLDPEAASLAVLWQAFAGVFQHGNIRTPPWLGYLIQRPEQHCIHHQRDVHGFNYANLPLWDLLFGTFRNPRDWRGVAGFYSGASKRLWPMLMGRDVSTPTSLSPRCQSLSPAQLRMSSEGACSSADEAQ